MKEFWRAENSAAKHLADRLMSETYTENWHASAEPLDNFHRNARVFRRPRAGRDYDSLRPQFGFDLINGDLVVSAHFDQLTKFTEILNQVVSE